MNTPAPRPPSAHTHRGKPRPFTIEGHHAATKPARTRNPFVPEYQRPERYDETWERRRDPVAYQAVREVTRRGY